MNSDLLKSKLSEQLQKSQELYDDLKKEFDELNAIDHEQTKDDLKRIKEIRKTANNLKEANEELANDIKSVEELENEVKALEEAVDTQRKSNSTSALVMIEQMLDSKREELNDLIEELQEKYSFLFKEEKIEDNETEEAEIVEEPTKKKNNKKAISIIALLLALGIGFTIGNIARGNDKKNRNNKESLNAEITETLTEEEKEVIGTFLDINDEEEVNKRANEIVEELKVTNPSLEISMDEVVNMLNWLNGGVVNNATRDEELFVVNRFQDILNRENQGEAKEIFDYSQLFLDGSQGQKLASQIVEVRKDVKKTRGTDQVNVVAKDLAMVMTKSTKLNGVGNTPSVRVQETQMMGAFNLAALLNTYAFADVTEDVLVTINGVEFKLQDVADELNLKDCPMEVTADNGDKVTINADLYSSLLNGAFIEANAAKENTNTKTLTLN